jgi:hypothetical protein
MPRRVLFAVPVVLLAVLVGAPTASAKPPKAPTGLKAFLLRVNEPDALYNRTFPRTPAFAWKAVKGAKRYEFEVSTSENFSDSAVIYSSVGTKLTSPTATVPISLPWMTGNPYAL